jgi:hypothetical protein
MGKALADSFTPEVTRGLLDELCRTVELDSTAATLLRHQTNAVYKLDRDAVIVKIARPDYSLEHIRTTVALTRWLMARDFPTVPLLDIVQPVMVQGMATTLWQYLPQYRPMLASDIAVPLRMLHELPLPPVRLPEIEAVAAIRYSLDREHILTSDDHRFLMRRCDELSTSLADLRYDTPRCLIHGDPQHANALWGGDGPLLADWDSAAIGHKEWDLVTIEVHCRRFGHPMDQYLMFCDLYGGDIRDWPGYPVLRDVRELRMITTNARKSPPDSRGADEVRRRVAQLRAGTPPEARWYIL